MRGIKLAIALLLSGNLLVGNAQQIPSPKEHFGFSIGDDYMLANYTQTESYFKKLAAASNRVKLVDIGKTEEGRTQYTLIITDPENYKNLDRYKKISQQLAHAEGITDEQAKAMASEGKAVVWIDGGLHATEVVGAHQLIETAWQLCSRNDDETQKILKNVIVLMTHANPDGQELVSNWYMRESNKEKRTTNFLPRLYEKYAGHDNNRDFYMFNLKETQNMGRQLFVEWLPQIMYNHHQTGPAGSVVAGPPFRDPFNYTFDPLVMTSLDAVGAAMINRLNAEGKPGYTERAGSVYSTWYNGGLRTSTYFHNMVGLLTEIIGSPTPSEIPVVPERLIPSSATPFPVLPQKWRFRNSIDYSVSLNYAVLMYAVRHKDELLYNIYKMGKNSIERGEKDNWTLSPKRSAEITKLFQATQMNRRADSARAEDNFGGVRASNNIPLKLYDSVLRNKNYRDPRGYIISSNQADFTTATRFINTLIASGLQVQKATADFEVSGIKYPAGSYVVKTNQAFRPHILDMFEPQDHPNDFQYPGGPPIPPYDAAGWTLAYQMGIQFTRVLDAFDGPFEKINYGELQTAKSTITKNANGYILNASANNAFAVVNDLLKAGVEVYRINDAVAGADVAKGSFYIPSSSKTKITIEKVINDFGVNAIAAVKKPSNISKVSAARIALWDNYGGSMPSGWVRYIFEQYHFNADIIYAKDIDTGNLKSKYDVIVFVGGAIPSLTGNTRGSFFDREPKADSIPEEYRNRLGRITAAKSIPQLKKFLEDGGNIITIGSSTNLAYHLSLPVKNALMETVNGVEKTLPGEKFYIPGSILNVKVDSTEQAAYGFKTRTDVYFDASPVFNILPEAQAKGTVKPIAWFDNAQPLRSGWAWGQSYLNGGVAAFKATVGAGTLYAFGPEITFRAQPYGTFKFLFNGLYK
ncbi:MAG: peptidase [Sphingobacteriia bacterium]|nr:peptidase [Sphingobacteriia bacterium]